MKVYEVQVSKTYTIRAEGDGEAGQIARDYFKEDIIKTLGLDFGMNLISLGLETYIVEKE